MLVFRKILRTYLMDGHKKSMSGIFLSAMPVYFSN